MFIGHYAVGLAAKKATPRVSLGALFLSVQWLDLLWPLFLLSGLEHVRIAPGITKVSPLDFYDYPITHSLVAVIGWSLAFGLGYFFLRRYRRGAWILGAGVLSHWVLDAIVHRPDLPILPGGPYIGLGLWNSVIGAIVVELGLFVIGITIYLRTTVALDRIGRYSLWLLLATLLGIWVLNITGPPPPTETAIAIVGTAQWLFIPWAYWIDRHREMARGGSST
ncbi:MAG: hypothetical protein HY314_15490 [Acidobacteria bacterium]|nr:hypothetical protein [Acidobacteriota bacterium]